MTRRRAAGGVSAVMMTLALLLGACSPDSPGPTGSTAEDSPDTSSPSGTGEPGLLDGVFDPDEPTLPGGVRVLSQDIKGFAPVEAGRHAVRVSTSLLYQFDLPPYSDVHSGVYLNPGRRTGGDSIVWLTPANRRTALPIHPCRNHDPRTVGPSVGDLASALADQPYLTTTRPVDVTIGRADGLFIKTKVRDGADVSACQGGLVDVISGTQGVDEPGTVDRMWILDIRGVRHVLRARTFGATGKDARLVKQLVSSITFTRG